MVDLYSEIGDVVSRPIGNKVIKGHDGTTDSDYVEIVSYLIPTNKRFHLAKIKVPCKAAHWIRLTVGDTVYPADINPDETTFIDWFPWDDGILGDGTKKVKIEAKKLLAGTEDLYGTIIGEE